MSFYMTLPSDSSLKYFLDNTPEIYLLYLPETLKLNGPYGVALTEINYLRTRCNVTEHRTVRITLVDPPKVILVMIPKGYYETIYDLLALFEKLENGIGFDYEERLKKVAVRFNFDYVMRIPGDIAVMLGFTLNDKEDYVISKSTVAPYIVDLDAGLHSLFVYSDVVKNTIVGDSNVPLLRIISARGKDGETVNTEFSRPHYLPVASSEIQTIEINIMDDLGNPVRFERGKVHVNLHFRPRRAWLAL